MIYIHISQYTMDYSQYLIAFLDSFFLLIFRSQKVNYRLFIALNFIKKTTQVETTIKTLKKMKNSKAMTLLNSRYKNQLLNSQFTIPIHVTFTIHISTFKPYTADSTWHFNIQPFSHKT